MVSKHDPVSLMMVFFGTTRVLTLAIPDMIFSLLAVFVLSVSVLGGRDLKRAGQGTSTNERVAFFDPPMKYSIDGGEPIIAFRRRIRRSTWSFRTLFIFSFNVNDSLDASCRMYIYNSMYSIF